MFKSIKKKFVSFLMIVGALTQTVKASEPVHQETAEQKTVVSATPKKEPVQNPFLPIDWKVGGSIGLLALGALTIASASRSGKHITGDERYFQDIWASTIPDTPAKNAPVAQSTQVQTQNTTPQPAQSQPAFDPMAIRPLTAEQDMTPDERALLATRLEAIRELEEINRERAKLTRKMAKAKNENDQYTIDLIIGQRKALSILRKEAFAQAVGPVYYKIKEERRLLTKKMVLARRRGDDALKQEVIQRRAMLKEVEKQASFSVRKFIKKKSAAPATPLFTMKDYDRTMAA